MFRDPENPNWSTACPDWRERILKKKSLIATPVLFPEEGRSALAVFKSLKIVDVAGRPTFGEAAREWVFDFVEAIFGAYDDQTGVRLIEEFLLLIAKKNGKSTLAAGIMLTALIRNWRDSAELLILAPTIEIAKNSFRPAADMVRADPQLMDLFDVNNNTREITHRKTKATLKVVAADATIVGGKKAAFILVDELWLFGKMNNADSMLSEATGGRASRPEGFVIYLSTHSDAPPQGVFKDKLQIFREVRDGLRKDPKKMPVLYEYPEDMLEAEDYLKPEFWFVTNPNIGLSQTVGFIQSSLDDATDPGQRRVALAKWLNVEIGMNLRADRWPGAVHWPAAVDEELEWIAKNNSSFDAFKRLIDRCECVVAGYDGGGLDDLSGLNFLGRVAGEIEIEVPVFGNVVKRRMKRWLSWSHAFCYKGVLDTRKSIASTLRDFEKAGELTIVGEKLEDLASIVELVRIVKDAGKFGGVGVDPAGLGDLVELFAEIGITEENNLLFGVPQGWGMMKSIKTSERRLVNGMLKHSGGVMMPWAVANMKIEPTATGIRATKQNAGDAKIDPIMALFNSVTVMETNPEPFKKPSYKMFVLS